MHPFHLAVPVEDLDAARAFYGTLLGCREGRYADAWIDFDFFGHQLTVHLQPRQRAPIRAPASVDDVRVPIPHFGVVLDQLTWGALAKRLRSRGTPFIIEPLTRFPGQPGEQSTMFLEDPSGNALEFKSMANPGNLFEA